jgi:hypothetical protein
MRDVNKRVYGRGWMRRQGLLGEERRESYDWVL